MISIIVPIYNGEKYIKNILSDFQNQKEKSFEVIFVDDGSNDNSYDCLMQEKETGEYSFSIKVIKQENKGVSTARNTGIKHAQGNLICFVDVDDGIVPEYLLDMKMVIEKENVDAVICKTANTHNEFEENFNYTLYSKIEILQAFLYQKVVTGIWSMMIKTEIIQKNNLFFADGYKYSEDLHMAWRIFAFSDKVAVLDEKLYVYNVNAGSAMGKFNSSRKDSLELMKNLEPFFEINVPEFSKEYNQYAVARMSWSLLWQSVYHFNDYKSFRNFVTSYHFKSDFKKLFSYNQKYVALSSVIFCISPKLYYYLAKNKIKNINLKFKKEAICKK